MDGELNLAHCFVEGHPTEAARVLEQLPAEELVRFFDTLPPQVAAELLKPMDAQAAARCLEQMNAEAAPAVVSQLPLEKTAVLMRRLDDHTRDRLLQALPAESATPLALVLRYGENTAGALMNPRAFTLPADIAAEEGLRRIHASPGHATYYVYVVERDHSLVGVVNLRELMAAPAGARIETIMRRDVVRVQAVASLEAVSAHPGWLEYHTLPVVDENGLFVGSLRYKALRRLASQAMGPPGSERAGAALGELYRIGLDGLIKGAAESLGSMSDKNL